MEVQAVNIFFLFFFSTGFCLLKKVFVSVTESQKQNQESGWKSKSAPSTPRYK